MAGEQEFEELVDSYGSKGRVARSIRVQLVLDGPA